MEFETKKISKTDQKNVYNSLIDAIEEIDGLQNKVLRDSMKIKKILKILNLQQNDIEKNKIKSCGKFYFSSLKDEFAMFAETDMNIVDQSKNMRFESDTVILQDVGCYRVILSLNFETDTISALNSIVHVNDVHLSDLSRLLAPILIYPLKKPVVDTVIHGIFQTNSPDSKIKIAVKGIDTANIVLNNEKNYLFVEKIADEIKKVENDNNQINFVDF